MTNYFAIIVGLMQFGAAILYFTQGKSDHGLLWFLYGSASFVLIQIAS